MKNVGAKCLLSPRIYGASAYVLVVMLVLLPSIGSAQTAYKGLRWGDSPQTVQKSVADVVKEESHDDKSILQMQLAMFFLHGKEFAGHTPDPTENEPGELTSWTSQAQDTTYWFVDDRLVGVGILFMEGGALKLLIDKYGKLNPAFGNMPGLSLSTATWNRDPNRVAVWLQIENHLDEYVTYFDPRWFQKLERAAMDKWRKGNTERLD
jgi:hypothetical protein